MYTSWKCYLTNSITLRINNGAWSLYENTFQETQNSGKAMDNVKPFLLLLKIEIWVAFLSHWVHNRRIKWLKSEALLVEGTTHKYSFQNKAFRQLHSRLYENSCLRHSVIHVTFMKSCFVPITALWASIFRELLIGYFKWAQLD